MVESSSHSNAGTEAGDWLYVSCGHSGYEAGKHDLSKGVCIRPTTAHETVRIHKVFERLIAQFPDALSLPALSRHDSVSGGVWQLKRKPADEPFLVIASEQPLSQGDERIFEIASTPFLGSLVLSPEPGIQFSYSHRRLPILIEELRFVSCGLLRPVFRQGDASEYAAVYGDLRSSEPNQFETLKNYVEQYVEACSIPLSSPFRLVALVSIAEGLLSKKPDPNDPTTSLRRQLSRKIVLVANLDLSAPIISDAFPNTRSDLETVWKTLYDLRSEIAHGSTPNFQRDKFKLLVSLEAAQMFVNASVRMLLRMKLSRRQLMDDLQNI